MSSGGKKCIYVHMIGLYIRDVHVGRNYRGGHIDDIGRGSRKLCSGGFFKELASQHQLCCIIGQEIQAVSRL